MLADGEHETRAIRDRRRGVFETVLQKTGLVKVWAPPAQAIVAPHIAVRSTRSGGYYEWLFRRFPLWDLGPMMEGVF
jgi:hypothetical protein